MKKKQAKEETPTKVSLKELVGDALLRSGRGWWKYDPKVRARRRGRNHDRRRRFRRNQRRTTLKFAWVRLKKMGELPAPPPASAVPDRASRMAAEKKAVGAQQNRFAQGEFTPAEHRTIRSPRW